MNKLTVVVQGQVVQWTADFIETYKGFACVKEVILSTWTGENVPKKIFDTTQVIYSDKPANAGMGNRNLQIVSSKAGCQAALTEWVVKVRSDTFLPQLYEMADFADDKQSDEKQLFCINLFPTYPYHPNDWVFLGRWKAINELFDIPLDSIERSGVEDEQYWVDKVRSETYLGVHYCKKEKYLLNPRQYLLDISPERERILAEWHQVIKDRRFFIPFPKFDVVCPKHHVSGYPHNLMEKLYGCIYG